MELIAYVASPRKWKLQEKSARELLKYMIWEDPQELVGDLQRLGRKLAAPGDSCVFSVPAHVKHAGMLYLFANDDWMFYGNNSGSVTLKIEPIENTPADESVLVVGGH